MNTRTGSAPPSRPRPEGGRKIRPARRAALALAAIFLSGCATAPGRPDLPPSVDRFLDRNGWDLAGYESSDLRSLEAYRFHIRTYRSPVPLDVAWKAYAALDPSSAWTTNRTRPGVVWDPASSRLYAPGDSAPAFSAGQVYVIDLRILGFLRIPAAFRITRIDEPKRLIEFVYLRRNLSNGLQRIRFLELPGTDGTTGTFIRHVTWYRSGRSFRDAALYGPVHAALIDAFHTEVFRRIGQPLAASPE